MIIQFVEVMQASWRVHYKHSVSSSVLSFFTEYFFITDCFSKDLQSAEIDIETARRKTEIVITAIEGLRSDPSFQNIWTSTVSLAGKIKVEEPVMPSRPTRRPARYEHGTAGGHVFATASDEYKAMIYTLSLTISVVSLDKDSARKKMSF